jgi:enterochelin esterase-like enzyme
MRGRRPPRWQAIACAAPAAAGIVVPAARPAPAGAGQPTPDAVSLGNRDTLFLAENKVFDKELTAAGIPHAFRIYPGAHTQAFWAAHRDEWLAAAVRALEPAR